MINLKNIIKLDLQWMIQINNILIYQLYVQNRLSNIQNWNMKQNKEYTRQNVLNKLYNQDIAPEDSQITSFYYHKTLALECLIATFSLCSVVLMLISILYKNDLPIEIRKRTYNLIIVFTILGVLGIIFKKISEMKWIKEKKQKNINIKKQIIFLLIQVVLYIPCPLSQMDKTFQIVTYQPETKEMNYNSFISFYLLFSRFTYIIIFLIHSQLFYGSRPDRLSRLYTVKFGTFNAIKFLINQKPGVVVKTTFSFNFLVLPFAILLIEGEVNQLLSSFHSCLYYVVVTQVTVGYGDIVVVTIFGRMVVLLVIMAGMTNTALLLILFMRLMELRGEEEESLFLLQSLQRKVNLTKARVFRIQNQWIYSNMRCTPQKRAAKQEEIKAIRYNNRRNIMLDRAGPINIKRMMLSNFSEIVQNLNQIRQKNNIIAKCIDVIKNSDVNDKKDPMKESNYKTKSQRQEIAKQFNKTIKTREKFRVQVQKENMFLKATLNKPSLKQSFSQLINKDERSVNDSKLLLVKNQNLKPKKKQKVSGFLYGFQKTPSQHQ